MYFIIIFLAITNALHDSLQNLVFVLVWSNDFSNGNHFRILYENIHVVFFILFSFYFPKTRGLRSDRGLTSSPYICIKVETCHTMSKECQTNVSIQKSTLTDKNQSMLLCCVTVKLCPHIKFITNESNILIAICAIRNLVQLKYEFLNTFHVR